MGVCVGGGGAVHTYIQYLYNTMQKLSKGRVICKWFFSVSFSEQSSADNAEVVGLMAQDFAKKGWHFAQRQQSQHSTRPTRGTPPDGTRRNYSSLSSTRAKAPPLWNRATVTSRNPGRNPAHYSSGADEESLMALMTGDFGSFPPPLSDLREKLAEFMRERVFPNEEAVLDHQLSSNKWTPSPLIKELKVCNIIPSFFLSAPMIITKPSVML